MLKMIKGVKINDADKLNEEYTVDKNSLVANINADKILKIINDFVDMQKEPLFLILEVPTIFYGKDDSKKYTELLNNNGIKKVDELVTAWNFFNESNPGECNRIDEDGKSVYDAIKVLTKETGLYLAERREY